MQSLKSTKEREMCTNVSYHGIHHSSPCLQWCHWHDIDLFLPCKHLHWLQNLPFLTRHTDFLFSTLHSYVRILLWRLQCKKNKVMNLNHTHWLLLCTYITCYIYHTKENMTLIFADTIIQSVRYSTSLSNNLMGNQYV